IFRALAYIHGTLGVCHRDIKTQNVLEESDSSGMPKNFMAFGGGMRFCVGTDFTKMEMAVFLHYLVINYR
ncbi:hypothetical protein Taro_035045, partial [Colocasia esculenta]|nr:hypothetical protein [Colocasia esculenta]